MVIVGVEARVKVQAPRRHLAVPTRRRIGSEVAVGETRRRRLRSWFGRADLELNGLTVPAEQVGRRGAELRGCGSGNPSVAQQRSPRLRHADPEFLCTRHRLDLAAEDLRSQQLLRACDCAVVRCASARHPPGVGLPLKQPKAAQWQLTEREHGAEVVARLPADGRRPLPAYDLGPRDGRRVVGRDGRGVGDEGRDEQAPCIGGASQALQVADRVVGQAVFGDRS